jgi:peptidyl-tRNA hydrolase, PTH1 family
VGSTEFPRLRMGIGVVPPRIDATAYVLTSFDRTEQPIVDRALGAAADAIELWLCKGSEHVMNQFNRRTTSEGV